MLVLEVRLESTHGVGNVQAHGAGLEVVAIILVDAVILALHVVQGNQEIVGIVASFNVVHLALVVRIGITQQTGILALGIGILTVETGSSIAQAQFIHAFGLTIGSTGFTSSRIQGADQETAHFRRGVGDGVVQARLVSRSTQDRATASFLSPRHGIPTGFGLPRIQVRVNILEVAQTTQLYGTEVTGQAHEAVTGSPGVAGVLRAAVDADFLLDLPDSLQTVAQIFATLETDLGVVVFHTGHGTIGLAVDGGLGVFQRSACFAVDHDIGHGGSRQGSNCQSNQFFHGAILMGKKSAGPAP